MKGEYMSERHVGKVIQVMGPVLDIRFQEGQLPELLNAIEIENQGSRVIAEVAQQIGDDVVQLHCDELLLMVWFAAWMQLTQVHRSAFQSVMHALEEYLIFWAIR